jgi:hypothetical protein
LDICKFISVQQEKCLVLLLVVIANLRLPNSTAELTSLPLESVYVGTAHLSTLNNNYKVNNFTP